jgi:hypothetical protein
MKLSFTRNSEEVVFAALNEALSQSFSAHQHISLSTNLGGVRAGSIFTQYILLCV